jgi:hypothetical protein
MKAQSWIAKAIGKKIELCKTLGILAKKPDINKEEKEVKEEIVSTNIGSQQHENK